MSRCSKSLSELCLCLEGKNQQKRVSFLPSFTGNISGYTFSRCHFKAPREVEKKHKEGNKKASSKQAAGQVIFLLLLLRLHPAPQVTQTRCWALGWACCHGAPPIRRVGLGGSRERLCFEGLRSLLCKRDHFKTERKERQRPCSFPLTVSQSQKLQEKTQKATLGAEENL